MAWCPTSRPACACSRVLQLRVDDGESLQIGYLAQGLVRGDEVINHCLVLERNCDGKLKSIQRPKLEFEGISFDQPFRQSEFDLSYRQDFKLLQNEILSKLTQKNPSVVP